MIELSIIIINYKTTDLICKCIASIGRYLNFNLETIILDNNSQDDSKELITSKFPQVRWIDIPYNSGFGRANNLGVAAAKGEYILLLNSDIVLQEGTIQKCLDVIQKDPKIGALGCKLLNEDGSEQKSVYYHIGDFEGVLKNNLLYEYFFYKKPSEIKGIMGAFMLIPRKVFEEVGGFDPDFFMYGEELELCNRIRKSGFKIAFTDEAAAIHKHGGSSKGNGWAQRQNHLSNALLFLKTKGLKGYFIYHFLFIFTFCTNLLLLWKMDKNYRRDFWPSQKPYFVNLAYYFMLPFYFKPSPGNGKRMLKRT